MAHYYKVLWQEGMLVAPQHFQQWDHYCEAMLELRVKYLEPFSWGVMDMEINREMLAGCRIFELTAFRGVYPSGTVVDIPDGDVAPASREVRLQDVPYSCKLGVYLALPLSRPSVPYECPDGSGGGLDERRYVPQCVCVPDENDVQSRLEIVVARKNLKIKFDNDPDLEHYERMKIAELERKGDVIELNEKYVPPCMVLSASSYLLCVLNRILNRLREYNRNLPPDRRRPVKTLLVRYTLNAFIPLLDHFCTMAQVHPEVVFRSLLQIAGQLGTLSANVDGTKLPRYDHENLSCTFTQLEEDIYESLNPLRETA